jgi:hypothetical protein
MKLPSNLGMLLLGIWLVLQGILGLPGTIGFGTLVSLLAIVAGILIVMGR